MDGFWIGVGLASVTGLMTWIAHEYWKQRGAIEAVTTSVAVLQSSSLTIKDHADICGQNQTRIEDRFDELLAALEKRDEAATHYRDSISSSLGIIISKSSVLEERIDAIRQQHISAIEHLKMASPPPSKPRRR